MERSGLVDLSGDYDDAVVADAPHDWGLRPRGHREEHNEQTDGQKHPPTSPPQYIAMRIISCRHGYHLYRVIAAGVTFASSLTIKMPSLVIATPSG